MKTSDRIFVIVVTGASTWISLSFITWVVSVASEAVK